MAPSVRLIVNGVERSVPLEPERSLLACLREELGLTGPKPGCGEGACGACTVLIDGRPERACIYSLSAASGHLVTTIEGLARAGRLHPVQRAFVETGAMQCGYCIPGMVLGTVALLAAQPDPTDADVVAALEGHLCRCCGYPAIRRAIARAAELARSADEGDGPEADHVPHAPATIRSSRGPWDLLEPDERDYFSSLPDGLVVVLPPGRSTWWSTGGAWLHIGANGIVTAFTGKVDVGQDNGTALALLTAEELRLPLASIRVVMGDTDVCPFDVGTFGSRSMADAGGSLRATAVAARELLIATAASRWRVQPAQLEAADGVIRVRGGRRRIAYADLLKGVRRVETVRRRAAVTPAARWRTAGQSVTRRDAVEIVTGMTRYPSDLTRPNLWHGRILRPPALGASLTLADLSGVRAEPGIAVVEDGPLIGVAASDPATADRALGSIEAHWRFEPQPNEADLEQYLRAHPLETQGWEGAVHDERGSVARARSAAPIRLEATYTTAYIAHAPLETRVALAEWEGDRLTVWTGSQRPFAVREGLAEAFELPEAQVRVVGPLTGGGFGGKHTEDIAIEAARLARASGHPVKVRWTREEEFMWAYVRPAAVIDVRSSATTEGRITAWEFTNINSGSAALETPYEISNQRIDFQPAASPLPQGSYRALAATANTFARESHMDELAHRLDQDPLELRLAHLSDERLAAVFRTVADRLSWDRRSRGAGSGVGIAGGIEKDGRVATGVEVRAQAGRSLEIVRIVTAYDCGAIVNPDSLRNQVEGATVMGLGGALFEAIHFENGRVLNPAYSRYRVPRFSDVPAIEVVLVDRRDVPPAGAGETPMIAVAPALANAIFEATGQRLRSLPLLPNGVLPGRLPGDRSGVTDSGSAPR
ncbi:MAG TPA: molybdopterin cofactor-binding domain-containing protein [Candidatus Limnocylindrales bacterium]|nr:molybdopterin cofactor-binding domain-containing protein [Candidatus Limnocylindrales bacterium]